MMPNMISNQMYQYQNQQRQRQEQLTRRNYCINQSCLSESLYADEDIDSVYTTLLDTKMPSDRYGKISKKDTSQGFMQLLDSGSIDGSFTGMFLYFPQITGISLIILHVLHS